MGRPPKPLLIAVTVALGLVAAAGFGLGFSGTMARHRAASGADTAPIAGNVPAGVKVQEAQPYVPAQAAPPKAKPVNDDGDESDKPASAAPSEPKAAAGPEASPAEAAPAAPPAASTPAAPKLPDDLPPT